MNGHRRCPPIGPGEGEPFALPDAPQNLTSHFEEGPEHVALAVVAQLSQSAPARSGCGLPRRPT